MKIGIISDTHNLLRAEVLETLKEAEVILHGGDICKKAVLDELAQIAPVYAVQGNNDKDMPFLPVFMDMELGGIRIYLTHKKKNIPEEDNAYDLIVYGHSHKFEVKKKHNTIYLNPGCCGIRKKDQEISMAMVNVDEDGKITGLF